jgi:molybdenum cofactor sulfurtransferase
MKSEMPQSKINSPSTKRKNEASILCSGTHARWGGGRRAAELPNYRDQDMLHNHAELRKCEFGRLDSSRQTYLDYTGAALYPESIVRTHAEDLIQGVLGNPHSHNPSSARATARVEEARSRVLEFFEADLGEYELVFTPNASGAIKLVAESYPFQVGSTFALTADNHNSVHGIRKFAQAASAHIRYARLDSELRVQSILPTLCEADPHVPNLFAYPAQSNFSGAKHSLDWIETAHEHGFNVLLDAAAFVPTCRLSLRAHRPEFVCVSFYKMFGYPTGLGALLARRDALAKLRRPWFAGGTVQFVSVLAEAHIEHRSARGFEDGTVNFLGIAAVPMGLDFIVEIGMENIEAHVADLTETLLCYLINLHHPNGQPLIRVYGPCSMRCRGGTVAFNVLDPSGTPIDPRSVESRASMEGISLRTGVFCNPGAAEYAFGYTDAEMQLAIKTFGDGGYSPERLGSCAAGKPLGAVRVSIGVPTNHSDITQFVAFLRTFEGCS